MQAHVGARALDHLGVDVALSLRLTSITYRDVRATRTVAPASGASA